MKKRIRALCALALALTLSLTLAVPTHGAETSEVVNAAAGKLAASLLAQSAATQAGWAVWQDGRIISSGSQAYRDGTPSGDAYNTGSISKVFTTVAVMQLAESGKLNLDQPVVKYLPAFKMADARYKDITVRMLLNHSSGLMGSTLTSELLFDDACRTDLLQQLSTQRLKAAPGAFSVYCNDGFTLAELVVEAVSGMGYMDYLRANILSPAGVEEVWGPEENVEDRRVPAYLERYSRPLPKDCMNVLGAAGLYATPKAVAAFGGALTDERLLKKSSLAAMASRECERGVWPEGNEPNAMTFGLGWDDVAMYPFAQNGVTALVKGGDTSYYHAGLVVIPEYRLSAAVLTAGGSSTYNEMAAARMLIAALQERGVETAELRLRLPDAQRADMPQSLMSGAGYYAGREVYEIKIARDGTLTMRLPASPALPERRYYYYSDGSFRNESGSTAMRIVKEKNGQTYLYQWAGSEASGLGWRYSSSYIAMKLPENKVPPELQSQWEAVMSKSFLPVNERWTSQVYMSLLKLFQVEGGDAEGAPGYIANLKIEDGTHLRYVPQVPGNAGRDGGDVELRRDAKGFAWLYQSNGSVYMEKDAAPAISAGKSVTCTIQSDGFARWYQVGDAAGKRMTVQVPENAGFWVYGSGDAVVASSVVWGDTSVKLPPEGMIAFAGLPGAQFQLTFE